MSEQTSDDMSRHTLNMGAKEDAQRKHSSSAKSATTTLMNIASIVEKADEQVR